MCHRFDSCRGYFFENAMKFSWRYIKISLHLLLVVWGCGLGPLTYFEQLSAHQGVRAGSFAVLGLHVGQNPQLPPEIEAIVYRRPAPMLAHILRRVQAKQRTPALTAAERSPLNILLHALTSGEMLHAFSRPQMLRVEPSLRLTLHPIAGTSACLAPPPKPPSHLA